MNQPTSAPPSGLGISKVLVSPGAEDFDPDSMLDDDDESSLLSQDPAEVNKRALALAPKPFLALTLAPPLSEPFQVAGFLHKMTTCNNFMFMEFECLFSVALELSTLPFAADRTAFMSCEFQAKDFREESSKMELHDWILQSVGIDEIMGTKAKVRLQFAKVEPAP